MTTKQPYMQSAYCISANTFDLVVPAIELTCLDLSEEGLDCLGYPKRNSIVVAS